jgi:diguanylate cyclase (GGDEF)-like protein
MELVVLHITPVRLAHAGEGESLTLGEAFIIPMALLLSPFEVVLILGLTSALGQAFRRAPPPKAVFNVGQTMLAAALGISVFHALMGSGGAGSARTIVAAAAAGYAYAATSSLLVSWIIAGAQGVRLRSVLFEGAILRAATWTGALSFGVLILLTVSHYPWSPVLSLGPIIALQFGYIGAVEQRRERRRIEGLYQVASELRSAIDEQDILRRLVPAAQGLLDSQEARLTDEAPNTGPGVLRAEIEPCVVLELVRSPGRRLWTPRDQQLLNAVAEVAGAALEKARLFNEVKHQALYDSLTGLPNQVLFQDRVDYALSQAERKGERLAVLFIDLDNFKRVNDTLGHHAGNVLLQKVSDRISGVIRSGDTLARMSGDEFTLLMPDIRSLDDACAVSEKITASLREPFQVTGHRLFCSASIGVAAYPDHAIHFGGLLQNSDLAMYQAKAQSRGTYRVYTASMSVDTHGRIELETDLRQALDRDQLRVMYQPQVDLDSGRIVGVEALVRWQHPVHGLLGPDRFIPLAEDVGLIGQVDRWVLRAVCEQAKRWERNGLPQITIAVNLSGAELSTRGIARDIIETITAGGMPPSQLEIEVTESVAVQEGTEARSVLEELREHGIHLAIDDFGTGYSTLARLSNFPVDSLKIDKSFVDAIGTGAEDAPLVVAIIAMAHSLNLTVVAEGVERVEQLNFLRQRGCDRAQGYLLGRPVFGAQLADHLAEQLPVVRLAPLWGSVSGSRLGDGAREGVGA